MPSPGLNVGDVLRNGPLLATREVLAILHEVCRRPGAFPQSPDDLWVTDTGEVLIAHADRAASAVDPRDAVAALLDVMLPADSGGRPERVVPQSLRGLPSRLRGTTGGTGASVRRDLMSILKWHLDAEPRDVIQGLASRVLYPERQVEVATEIEEIGATPAPVPLPIPPRRQRRIAPLLAIIAAVLLMAGIGSMSYWLVRDNKVIPDQTAVRDQTVATVERPAPQSAGLDRTNLPSQIAMPGGAFSPAFGATGRELFFHAGRNSSGRILMASLDTTGRVDRVSEVMVDAARNYHPRVSPDGRWIAFDSDRDGERGVYVMERGGTAPERVSGGGYAAVPSWSPDMKWLAFIRGEPARPRVWNLWLRDIQSGRLRRHTSFRAGQVWGASWFPDGRRLAYSHEDRLIISHLDGRDDIIISSPRRGQLVRTPAVSPDGRQVVFQVFRNGVWLLDVDTGDARRILDDASAEEFAWSPDGRQIAYHSRHDGAWKIRFYSRAEL